MGISTVLGDRAIGALLSSNRVDPEHTRDTRRLRGIYPDASDPATAAN
jgi:hypothetical protein